MNGKKVALFYNIGSDFYRNRIHYAHYLQEKGYQVTAILPNDGYAKRIEQLGVKVVSCNLPRNTLNPFLLSKTFRFLKMHFEQANYDILHTFRPQPNLLGAFALKRSLKTKLVCHVTGLGILFSGGGWKKKVLRFVNLKLYQLAFRKAISVVVQNPDDYQDLSEGIKGLKSKLSLIKGSGVNPDLYHPDVIGEADQIKLKQQFQLSKQDFVITFVSRLLWQKGVREIVEAAQIIHQKYSNVIFLMVGYFDEGNPTSVDQLYVDQHNNKHGLKFVGKRNDVKEILSISDLYIFPSYYREGIPRSILEAMSMALPIVTTNSPGCNLTVDNEKNGFLIPTKDSFALVNAISLVLDKKTKAKKFGLASREKLKSEFSDEIVFKEMEALYN